MVNQPSNSIGIMEIKKENEIGEIVAKNFNTAAVFASFGIDFCCGGKKTIEEACSDAGVDTNLLISELTKAQHAASPINHYDRWEMDFLVHHIVNKHHEYVRRMLPTIVHQLKDVVNAHGNKHPEIIRISEMFSLLREEMLMHMQKEETMLFPYIQSIVEARKNSAHIPYPPFGSVDNPIRVLESEHDNAGNLIKDIRKLSEDFSPPDDACTTYKLVYQGLREFEKDLHTHIHLENNILFPRAIQMEKALINNTN